MENNELNFDDIIQSKLDRLSEDQLAEETASNGWLAMSEKLDVHLPRTEDQIFDSILRDKVTEVETTVAGNWSAIHADLDDIKSIDDQKRFDKIINNKIGYFDYPRGANWPKLLGQLEEWEYIRRQLITTRIVEAFAIIVLLMSGYGGFNSIPTPDDRQPLQERNESVIEAAIAQTNITELSSIEVAGTLLASVENKSIDQSFINNNSTPDPSSTSNGTNLSLTETSLTVAQILVHNNIPLAEVSVESIRANTNSSPIINTANNYSNKITAIKNTKEATNSLPISKHNEIEWSLLKNKSYSLSPQSVLNVKETTPVIAHLKKDAFSDGWSIGLGISLDQHYIATPYDTDFNLSALERFSRGYGGSIRFNKKFDKWNIESGVAYHYTNYQPKEFTIVDGGSFNTGYELVKHSNTELHFVEIPLEFQHNIASNSRLRFYANIGTSANINVASKYTFERTSQDKSNQRPAPALTLTHAPQALSAQKDYTSGALEGGSILDNSYFTANVGFGLDYHLTEALNIFFQSTYHHRIGRSEIGPNDDLFHLTSINFGARFPLNNK